MQGLVERAELLGQQVPVDLETAIFIAQRTGTVLVEILEQAAGVGVGQGPVPLMSYSFTALRIIMISKVSGAQLEFLKAPDFEAPIDADGDNVYRVQVTADAVPGGETTQDLSITVANDPADDPPPLKEPIEVAALDFLL